MEWADSDTETNNGINHLVGNGANAQSITMTWAEPATGGTDITGYEIQVWDGSKWVKEATLAATDLTTLSYTDTGLNPGANVPLRHPRQQQPRARVRGRRPCRQPLEPRPPARPL